MQIQARPYQHGAYDAFLREAMKDVCRQLIVLPTGTGKTITALMIAMHFVAKGRPVLWLAHREELIEQPGRTLDKVWPGTSWGIVKAERNQWKRDIVFASVQTVCRPQRLGCLMRRDWGLVVVDEAHHATAGSYKLVLDGVGAGTKAPLLGLTATPEREDNAALDDVFDGICYQLHLKEAIDQGYLVMPELLARPIDVNLDKVGSRAGDYKTGELDVALMEAGIVDEVVAAHREHAAGKRVMIFTVSVKQAELVAEALRGIGVAAESVYGDLDKDERRKRLKRFHLGETTTVTNCMVLTEGFDEPAVDCIIMARPTQSKPLYVQCVGRGLRLHPGKDSCVVIDMVGVSSRHTLVQAPVIFGVEVEEAEEKEGTGGAYGISDPREYWRKRLEAQAKGLRTQGRRALRWIRGLSGEYLLRLGSNGTVRLIGDDEQDYVVEVVGSQHAEGVISLAQNRVDLQLAQGIAEDYVRRCGAVAIAKSDRWRGAPATDKQIAALKRAKIEFPMGVSKGEASDLLTAITAKRHEPATDKQVRYLRALRVDIPERLTKREAGRLISEAKKAR